MATVRRSERLSVDQREVGGQTWHGIVWTALLTLSNRASLNDIYDQVQSHARVLKLEASGTDWKAVVRRVLQETCQPVERGVWALPPYVN